jgi:broad-specificity NMP kinase
MLPLGMRYLNVGDYVKERNLHSGWDEGHHSFILDEKNEDQVCCAMCRHHTSKKMQPGLDCDAFQVLAGGVQVLDAMEDQMTEGSNIVDYHSSELFPERSALI